MATHNRRSVLFVLTSVAEMPDGKGATGYFADEVATPYYALLDAGYEVDFASIAGGQAPVDPSSIADQAGREPAVQKWLDDARAQAAVTTSLAIDVVDPSAYVGIFLPGGHGTMWDFRQSKRLASLVGDAFTTGAVIGSVCHGPAGLIEAVDDRGQPLVSGRKLSAFTDAEERAVGLADTVPFMLEAALRDKGAQFESVDDFAPHAVRDGRLVTGQNPASAGEVARLLVEALGAAAPRRAV